MPLRVRQVPRYSALYREGSEAHSFYVLLSGRLEHATLTTGQRHEISAEPSAQNDGQRAICFGYEGLSGGLRRLATVPLPRAPRATPTTPGVARRAGL